MNALWYRRLIAIYFFSELLYHLLDLSDSDIVLSSEAGNSPLFLVTKTKQEIIYPLSFHLFLSDHLNISNELKECVFHFSYWCLFLNASFTLTNLFCILLEYFLYCFQSMSPREGCWCTDVLKGDHELLMQCGSEKRQMQFFCLY